MPKKKRKHPDHSHLRPRNAEVKELMNLLCKKYRTEVVFAFIERNYFLTRFNTLKIMGKKDLQPVNREQASIIYLTATTPDFHL